MAEFIVNPAEATTPIEVVCGNANAEIIRFTFDRNSDGVDLADCAWAVTAKNSGGFSDTYMEGHGITNVSVSDTTISVDWALFGIAVGATGRTKYQLIGLQGKAIVKQFPYHTLNVLSYLESTLSTEAQEDVSALWETIEYVGNQLPEILDAEAARKVAEKGRVNAENERVAAENMRDHAEDERIVFENQRRGNEDERIQLEAQRRSAEADRVDSEVERKSEEAERVAAENVRMAAESARAEAENERVAAENARKAAENARASAESKRVASENDRVSNENQRQANEAERVRLETQRRIAEADRVESEEKRKAAEAIRVSAESNRVSAENARSQAEGNRATGFGRINLTTVKTGKVTTVTAVNAQGKVTSSEIYDGIDGNGLIIKGLYSSLSALKAAHPTGSAGDAYAVGTSSDNEVYVWDVDNRTWQNLGPLQGPQGAKGDKGDDGDKGDKGDKGDDGADAPQEAVLFVSQTLNATQKAQARTNLGLATVASSGSYNDLTNKPTIPAAVTVDSSLSSYSTNPVQNKVINSALSGKADSNHNQSANTITSGTLPVARGGTGNTSVDTTPTSGSTKMVTSGGVYTALSGKANSSHDQAASTITAGTLAGKVQANATAAATVTNAQVRDIKASTTDLTAGTSSLTSGQVYLVYE